MLVTRSPTNITMTMSQNESKDAATNKNNEEQQTTAMIGNAWIALARAEAASKSSSNDNAAAVCCTPQELWRILQGKLTPEVPFAVHRYCYNTVYIGEGNVKPCWIPSPPLIEETNTKATEQTNIERYMHAKGFTSYQQLYDYSVSERDAFWMESMQNVCVAWHTSPRAAFDLCAGGPAHARYFPGGKLNIADSLFTSMANRSNNNKKDKNKPAVVYANDCDPTNLQHVSLGALEALTNQVAHALTHKLNLQFQDKVAICLPMIPESLAVYLGIVKAGCVVVSIADSFSAHEIATRCRIAGATVCITQDVIYRGTKAIGLLERVLQADAMIAAQVQDDDDDDGKESKQSEEEAAEAAAKHTMKIVVLPAALHTGSYNDKGESNDEKSQQLHDSALPLLRPGYDWTWNDFLKDASTTFDSVICDSMDACNILFSSGTTGDPKAIVWTHSTPIKCAVDGHYHQDLTERDRIAWPTNMGWMMGPWLLYQLMNDVTICLYNGLPHTPDFSKFIEVSEVTILGVIPSLVKAWQARGSCDKADWSKIRRFSSTGEASDPVNYHWLMSRVPGYAPVIEYCGGTEIGGSFLSSTMLQPNVPSMFSTPVLGSSLRLLDESTNTILPESEFKPGTPNESVSGELVLLPPTIGLSTHLLNRDHYECYYAGMPSISDDAPDNCDDGQVLRRHGDCMEVIRTSDGTPYFHALGRCDDTMNLGGIKVSSVEIERVCNMVTVVKETAAIAVSSDGPSKLVVYAVVTEEEAVCATDLKVAMQQSIKSGLNPLFAISNVVITKSLPRTASNKVMRRLLRDDYVKSLPN